MINVYIAFVHSHILCSRSGLEYIWIVFW